MGRFFFVRQVFDGLRRESPHSLKKLVAISGDITLDGLGISAADLKQVTDNVSIVFHSAATLKFNEELKRAVEINIKGNDNRTQLSH